MTEKQTVNPELDFQGAKLEMDFTLRGMKQEIEANNIYGVKVSFDHPYLIGKGKNALVFKLPESGLIGKSSPYAIVPREKDPESKGYYMLAGYYSGLEYKGLKTTVRNLQRLDLDKKGIVLPKMEECSCKINLWHPKEIKYTLMQDLRENGKFRVEDVENFPFFSYKFGNHLLELFEEVVEQILKLSKEGSYKIICAGHGLEEDPEPAIRNMFLVQFNENEGRLFLADLNHLIIKRGK